MENKNIWIISSGENGKLCDEFKNKNKIAIPWGKLGDLNKFKNKEDIKNKLKELYPSDTKPTNNLKALTDFSKEMKIGDIVIVKKGIKTILGLGIISSNYQYSKDLSDDYCHFRDVKWEKTGQWEISDINLVIKTLTNLTPYPDYCGKIFQNIDYPFEEGGIDYHYSKDDFLNEVLFLESDYDDLVNLLSRKKNIILQGAPGVGKTFIAKKLAYSLLGEKNENHIEFIQFHQSYSYEYFIQGYKPTEDGFELKNGIFYEFCKKASKDLDNKYYFIIDEIIVDYLTFFKNLFSHSLVKLPLLRTS